MEQDQVSLYSVLSQSGPVLAHPNDGFYQIAIIVRKIYLLNDKLEYILNDY